MLFKYCQHGMFCNYSILSFVLFIINLNLGKNVLNIFLILYNYKGSHPTILLQQDPSYPEIYTGEQVKLVCGIQEKTSKWQYLWQKDSQQVNTDLINPVYTIQNATLSQKGEYTCQVRRREMTSAKSTNLSIRGKIHIFMHFTCPRKLLENFKFCYTFYLCRAT